MAASNPLIRGGDQLPPAEIFDAFASGGSEEFRRHREQYFEIVAEPGATLETILQPGDILLRRALGEGGSARMAFLVSGEIAAQRELVDRGWRSEANNSGGYALVVEAEASRHRLHQRFARRVTDEVGRLPRSQSAFRVTAARGERLPGASSSIVICSRQHPW